MKHLLITLLFAMGSSAFAAAPAAKSQSLFAEGGFSEGGFNLAGGYEYLYNGQQSVGGHLHYFPKDKDKGASGMTVIGGLTGFHFFKGDWDLAFTPSMNIISISPAQGNSKTSLGPALGISLVTAVSDKASIGFDLNTFYMWLDEDTRGFLGSSLNFRAKFAL